MLFSWYNMEINAADAVKGVTFMKMKKLAAAALAAMLATSSLSLSAFAEAEESSFEKRSVKAYLFSMDESKQLDCLFTKENPDMPYMGVKDYLDNIFTVEFTSEDKGNGVIEITGNNGTVTVDTVKDTVNFKNFEKLTNDNINASKEMTSKYVEELGFDLKDISTSTDIDFSKYGIDLLADDGKAYLPLTTLTDLFGVTYNSAAYLGGEIYFNHTTDIVVGSTYFNSDSVLETVERSQAMADYSYGELCFLMDRIYGGPSKGQLAASIKEKGFDKTLDEFSDITRAAKEHLKKNSWSEFYYGLYLLSPFVEDGGHTNLLGTILAAVQNEKTENTPLAAAYTKLLQAEDEMAMPAQLWIMGQSLKNDGLEFAMARTESWLGKLDEVRSWGDEESPIMLLADKDTAVFVFNSFMPDVVEPFKWSVDYAAEKGLKNFIVDLSTNQGGDSSIMCYMLTLMGNKYRHDNSFSYNALNTFTNTKITANHSIDINLDGKFDDKDKDVVYDLNFGIISSRVSYSCGNLMPCAAQELGIPVIGETSGGGGCMVGVYYYPNGFYNSLSTSLSFVRSDGTDVDSGVTVDYQLTATDKDKSQFYDLDLIKKDMDEYYGVAPAEESKPDSQSENKPADNNNNKSDQSNPPTGTAASLSLVAAAVGALIFIRKKNR